MTTSPIQPLRLLDYSIEDAKARLVEVLAELGEPKYRALQILRQVYARRVRCFDAMTDLPAALRESLAERVRIGLLELSHRAASADGTVKYLWRLEDGSEIETVAIPKDRWLSTCVSSQVGCALHCRFCATASLGLRRNLTRGEIVDQVLAVLEDRPDEGRSLSVVFMGMGEPGYNVENVIGACHNLNHHEGVGIGARHLTVSTSGVIPLIERLAAEPLQVRLALSLHAADQEQRIALMDVAKRFPLNELLASCMAYHDATGRFVMLEYAVMPGINDSPDDARRLGEVASDLGAKINLIPYNPVEGFECPPSSESDASSFRRLLELHFTGAVMVRRTRGRDIEAACGMLHRARAGAPS